MTTQEIDLLRERCARASDDLLKAINAFEHAVADCTTIESANAVAASIGYCYSAFDRLNSSALSRRAQFQVRDMLSVNRD